MTCRNARKMHLQNKASPLNDKLINMEEWELGRRHEIAFLEWGHKEHV